MTRKSLYGLLLGSLMGANLQAAELKIGVVNVPLLLEKAPQAEQAKKKMEREFSAREKKLVAEQEEIKQMEERLAKDSAVMSDAEREKLEKDVMRRMREVKSAGEEFRQDVNLTRNEELTKLQKAILEAIQSLAKEENFDLVLTDGVVYATESIDVTSKVASKLEAGGGSAKSPKK
ncbi:MAG: OmpH family outer membrane protein [Methylococcaceae bacterium]|nr:OmpH family outer membrane protein [Methylococcaceae bacterium]